MPEPLRVNCLILFLAFFICLFSTASLSQQESDLATNYLDRAFELVSAHPDSAFILAREGILIAQKSEDKYNLARGLQLHGMVFFRQGIYSEALEHYLEAFPIFESLGLKEEMAELYFLLGDYYYATRQVNSARSVYNKALEIFVQNENSKGTAKVYGGLGHLFEKNLQFDSALYFQEKAYALFEAVNDLAGLAFVSENIGSIYEDLEDFDSAIFHFKRAAEIFERLDEVSALSSVFNNIGDIFRKTGQIDSSEYFTRKAFDNAFLIGDKYQMSSALKDLGKLYFSTQRYEQAFVLLDSGRRMYEEMYPEIVAQELARTQTVFEIEKLDANIGLLEREKQNNLFFIIILALGIILIATFLLVALYHQKQKMKRAKLISQKEHELLQAQQALTKVQVENLTLSEEKLKAELDAQHLMESKLNEVLESRSKSLTAKTLLILDKNKYIEEVKSRLENMTKMESKIQKSDIRQLLKLLDESLSIDNHWEDFRESFENVHENFFSRLKELNADLTTSEIRLASLIKLNLNSKEISTLLGISQDSLRIARHRLKKKLQLDSEVHLSTFIQSLD